LAVLGGLQLVAWLMAATVRREPEAHREAG
jgi:hypothetical protein